MSYVSKKETCPLCKGGKVVTGGKVVLVIGGPKETSPETQEIVDAMANDMTCPNCHGGGEVSVPPYNIADKVQMSCEKMKELADAGTLLRCVGDMMFVQAVANQAARIVLPDSVAETYSAYWSDPERDATLGDYIMQIAQSAEELALSTYGDLGNPIFAGPRQCPL